VSDRCQACGLNEARASALEAENAALAAAALTDGIDLLGDLRAVEHKLELADDAESRRG
jgi:hypothetical protein